MSNYTQLERVLLDYFIALSTFAPRPVAPTTFKRNRYTSGFLNYVQDHYNFFRKTTVTRVRWANKSNCWGITFIHTWRRLIFDTLTEAFGGNLVCEKNDRRREIVTIKRVLRFVRISLKLLFAHEERRKIESPSKNPNTRRSSYSSYFVAVPVIIIIIISNRDRN